MRQPAWLLAWALIIISGACTSKSTKKTAAKGAADAATKKSSATPPAPKRDRQDPGSKFDEIVSKLFSAPKPFKNATATVKVTGQERKGRSLYLRVVLEGLQPADTTFDRYLVTGATGIAVRTSQRHQVLVKLYEAPKAGAVPRLSSYGQIGGRYTVGIRYRPRRKPGAQPVKGDFALTGIKAAPKEAKLAAKFHRALGQQVRYAIHGFGAFAFGRLGDIASRLEGKRTGTGRGTGPGRIPRPTRNRRSDLGRTMALYSGMTSIDEALQHDRGLLLRRDYKKDAKIPLSKIEGVSLPPHPWPKMIEELGKKPTVDPVAAAVPHNMAYVFAHDLRSLVKLFKDIDERFAHVAQALERRGGESMFAKRYEYQLAIRRSALAEKFGHFAASGVALVMSDPFIREGSDMTVAFGLGNEALLRTQLATYAAEAKARHPDLQESKYQLSGHEVELISTPDLQVHRHLMKLDKLLLVSNSKRALERFIAVKQGKLKSLAQSGDYQYMRAKYPFSKEAEDAFIFISDAFVANAIGPRAKILEARRMEARADLRAVAYGTMLYGLLEGRAPASLAEVIKAGYLDQRELKHGDGATIAYQRAIGPSSAWGRIPALKPLIDLDLDKVTPEEQAAYKRFRQSYQRYWRGYIDPIAIVVKRDPAGKRYQIDARMLPLISGSDYDRLIRMAGQTVVKAPEIKHGFQFTFAVGKDARLRKEVDGIASRSMRDLTIGWLGDWVDIGVADRGGLFDLAVLASGINLPDQKRGFRGLAEILSRAPLYVEAHLGSRVGLVAMLTALRREVEKSAPGMVTWGEGKPYRKVPVTEVTVRERRGESATVYYAVANEVITFALDKATLLDRIDVHLDKKREQDAAMQAVFNIKPWLGKGVSWITKSIELLAFGQSVRATNNALSAAEFLQRSQVGYAADLPGQVRSSGHLGFVPMSPFRGKISFGKDGLAQDSVANTPYQPKYSYGAGPIGSFLSVLKSAGFGITFEGKGKHRGLHVAASWAIK